MTPDGKLRVVVVDDSPFICRLITSYLHGATGFEVVGTALNGSRAIDLVEKLRPDVVTMDVEMPVMGGLEALEHIMAEFPRPVVMISGVGRRAAETTLNAIDIGAVDFILKCPPDQSVDANALREEIIAKVRSAASVKVIRSLKGKKVPGLTILPSREMAVRKMRRARRRIEAAPTSLIEGGVVVIGASTGGPVALRELLSGLPANYPGAIVIVQHIPENFTKVLAVQLDNHVPLTVKEAANNDHLEGGVVYLAPGGYHLLIKHDSTLSLSRGPEIRGHRPAIDVTMQAAAEVYGPHAKGILLTGMGEDGANGLKAIFSQGGITFAQDAESSVVDGMPKSARDRGVATHVGNPAEIARLLLNGGSRAGPHDKLKVV